MGTVHFKRFTHRGDGFVAARHLAIFGYRPTLYYPKKSRNEEDMKMMDMLLKQAIAFGVQTIDALPSAYFHLPDVRSREELAASYDLVVDAILGFSAHGALRAPYDTIIGAVNASSLPVVCIDIPSGWDVDEGDMRKEGICNADMLISLTAPKACARFFKGRFHYLGGRFVAPVVFTQFPVHLPPYSGCELCVRLPFPSCLTKCEAKCLAECSTNCSTHYPTNTHSHTQQLSSWSPPPARKSRSEWW